MQWLDHLQWPAMALTASGAWLVASRRARLRQWAFWIYLGSNVLWGVWGVHDRAWAVVVLQLALVAINIRGVRKTAPDAAASR